MPFVVSRGTNISHWLSQSNQRGDQRRTRFTREDVELLARLGLDHLRLPVDEEQLWDADGQREPEAWALLEACLDWCEAVGMRVIVDLHILRSHYFNQEGEPALFTDPDAPKRFAELWRELSMTLRARPTAQVAYELMNEPVANDARDWNRVARYPYQAIRAAEPERTIVLGSNMWNAANTFDALDIPAGDPHLLLTFHYYNPFLLTHYRAPWSKATCAYDGPIHYPGMPIAPEDFAALDTTLQAALAPNNRWYDTEVMIADLAQPLAAGARTGLPLYCGEFGVLHTVDDTTRRAWYRDIRAVFARFDIAWANWDYRGGFGLFDENRQPTAAYEGLLT